MTLEDGMQATVKVGSEIRTALKFLGPAIDYTNQINEGEDPVNAGIKTGAHLAIGTASMKVGAAIGTALFPGAGSIAGAAVGFVIGVGLSSSIE